MRTIRMYSTLATDEGLTAGPGDEIKVDNDRAAELVDGGFADYVDESDKATSPARRRRAASKTKTAGKSDGSGKGEGDPDPDAT